MSLSLNIFLFIFGKEKKTFENSKAAIIAIDSQD